MAKAKKKGAGKRAGKNAAPVAQTQDIPQQSRAQPATMEEAIAKAQQGRVDITPAKAIAMAGQLYSRGQFAQAARVCRQIIATLPANSDAHNILGVSLAAAGNHEAGVAAIRRAIELNPGAANYHANLGEVLRLSGKLDQASDALEQAIAIEPDNCAALNNLGIIQYERGNFEAAADFYRRALAQRPQMAEAYNNLGNSLRMTGDVEGALHAYQEALTQRIVYPEVYNNLGTLLQQDNKFEEAEHALRKAIQQSPNYVEAHTNLASLLFSQKNEIEALRILGDALKFAPKNVPTLLLTARIQLERHNLKSAEQASRFALQEEPENAEALALLGQVFHETDRYEEALEVLERSLEKAPQNAQSLNFYGVALKSVGRLDEARENILKALSINDSMYGAYANLHDLIDFSEGIGAELFDRIEAVFEAIPDPEAPQFLALQFAYAKGLDDRGQHEKALEHYITGGRMKRAQLDYNEREMHGFFDDIRAAFPKEVFENRKFTGLSDDRPVFIIGMPRSGSTLVEQILSSHPDIYGAGEVKYLAQALGQLRDRFPSLPKYPAMMEKITLPQLEIVGKNYQQTLAQSAGDAKRITDKLLTNYFFIGLINLLFPNAKVVHTRRDPIDTCLSGFTKLFADDMPHSYDLAELGRYYDKYRELMEHWEEVLPEGFMTNVDYEDVVADTQKEAKRLIAFLGLPWDQRCVDFYKSDRPVKTASVAQVRRPIYKTSVQRWKKYGAGLQPLIDAVGQKRKPTEERSKAKEAV